MLPQPSTKTMLFIQGAQGATIGGLALVVGGLAVGPDAPYWIFVVGWLWAGFGFLCVLLGGVSWYIDHEQENRALGKPPYREFRKEMNALADRIEGILERAHDHAWKAERPEITRRDFLTAYGGAAFKQAEDLWDPLVIRGVKYPRLHALIGVPVDTAGARELVRLLRELSKRHLHWCPLVRWYFNRKAQRDFRSPTNGR